MFEVLTPQGFMPFAGIQRKMANVVVVDGTTCSKNHLFKINDRFIEAKTLSSEIVGKQPVFDLIEVKGHEYYTDNKISHNCEFLGSSDTLIDPMVLARLESTDPLRKSEEISVFKEPVADHRYMVVADTARGVSGDYSAFLVIDVTSPPYEVVAQFRMNTIKPETYPNYIAHAAKIYNDAYVLAEDNDVGAQIISILVYDLDCENVMQTGTAGRAGTMLNAGNNQKFGIRTTSSVKRIGCFAMKSIVEHDQIVLNSEELVNELQSFISSGKSFEAQEGRHDDLAMCLVLFSWATTQTAFLDITEPADSAWKKIQDQKREKHEEDQLLFGIVDAGEVEEAKPIDFEPALSDIIENAAFEVGNW